MLLCSIGTRESQIYHRSFKHTFELFNCQDSEIEIVGGPLENTFPSELLKGYPLKGSNMISWKIFPKFANTRAGTQTVLQQYTTNYTKCYLQ
ncbi:hypothetical protein F8M41_003649 [Gigaspora margarita]|uniref:Uncharacterized protein n=1 Tax=Gigaspora margarita TaxID=4874 RepID=A0A8H4A8B4_GIGMA|nr:hypothetical protein F8M41_003649 [Gigaspora margarita]